MIIPTKRSLHFNFKTNKIVKANTQAMRPSPKVYIHTLLLIHSLIHSFIIANRTQIIQYNNYIYIQINDIHEKKMDNKEENYLKRVH